VPRELLTQGGLFLQSRCENIGNREGRGGWRKVRRDSSGQSLRWKRRLTENDFVSLLWLVLVWLGLEEEKKLGKIGKKWRKNGEKMEEKWRKAEKKREKKKLGKWMLLYTRHCADLLLISRGKKTTKNPKNQKNRLVSPPQVLCEGDAPVYDKRRWRWRRHVIVA